MDSAEVERFIESERRRTARPLCKPVPLPAEYVAAPRLRCAICRRVCRGSVGLANHTRMAHKDERE